MPLAIVKVFSNDNLSDLEADLATYKAGAGADLVDAQRAMASAFFKEADGDLRRLLVLAHGGLDTPASGAKTADLQHVMLEVEGGEAAFQAAIDAALTDVLHSTVTDGVTTTPGTVTSATGPFEAEDVGRKIRIGNEVRTITVFNAATSVDYDNSAAAGGDFASGTGLTVELLGAEVVQALDATLHKDLDGDDKMLLVMACEGELAQ